ncbi:MAG: L-serine ammonia-lyase [Alphaproteobacteria bacterium]|nr:L-serine ammonia-lyase [Alphaproteobacteria bacterium]
MFISIFDLFKIGIGPSSSHTMGPMVAASRFLGSVEKLSLDKPVQIRVSFYGSLAFTGKGHASDRAVILGLLGFEPATIDPDNVENQIENLNKSKQIALKNGAHVVFDPQEDIIFDYGPPLEGHPNGMIFEARSEGGGEDEAPYLKETYYSVGGGFVVSEEELREQGLKQKSQPQIKKIPYPFENADEMLRMAEESGLSIAQMKKENELTRINSKELATQIKKIWSVMNASIDRGLDKKGVLPGELNVKRRAQEIMEQLQNEERKNSQTHHICNEWLSVYAMAVNEENAAGGQIVTAPTNGAAGVVPAVLRYYLDFVPGANEEGIEIFLLTAAAIGGIIKNNASISGAEVGCQGEVGSASAMAAAGLCAVFGGTPMQIENAAEIALEHHLGMTCDPVAGLVQVPCIERNGLGAVKAVTAASLALRGDGTHVISLDSCIETMRQTGLDMSDKYKETSQGGLAVNFVEC